MGPFCFLISDLFRWADFGVEEVAAGVGGWIVASEVAAVVGGWFVASEMAAVVGG